MLHPDIGVDASVLYVEEERTVAQVGFGSVQLLRHAFPVRLALSPSEYRSMFALER